MAKGGVLRQVPISAVADLKYDNTFGGIKRKNNKKIITLSSNILAGYNPAAVVQEVEKQIAVFKDKYNLPESINIRMGGEQEQQNETQEFLGLALVIAIAIIVTILLLQFNSTSRVLVILAQIIFSIIGVLLGIAITGMKISIVMTGVGIVSLAGIAVRNGILLIEFADLLRQRGYSLREAIIEAGKERMTPVLMTASATVLGLIPLAIGFNIDFGTLFAEGNPNIYLGGDSVAFWGPLAWTMIYGLTFATILTLVLVPLMYWITQNWKMRLQKFFGKEAVETTLSSNGSLHKEETEVEALR
jgi:multidrug efflux pump subunit AcrB